MPDSPAAEIPIRRVVLYQNGVGYFERAGKLEGNVFSLQIRPSQINDLLKSLTVVDASKGRAVSISLPLEKSGDRVLNDLPEQVRNASGLLQILSVFRGARVELESTTGTFSGRIVGVENLEQRSGEQILADWRVTLRTDDAELVVIPVNQISKVVIADRTLAVGLEQSLDVSLNEGDWKPTTLSVHLTGDSSHDLRASYIVEMPRWKPAYRIVLSDKGPLLQGWAVVDNVSGEHWNGVQLSLVAGAPLSFIYDLHSSQYIDRVDMSPRGRQVAAAPPVEQGGTEGEDVAADGVAAEAAPEAPTAAPSPEAGFGRGLGYASKPGAGPSEEQAKRRTKSALADEREQAQEQDLGEMLAEQTVPSATGSQVGSLFRYDIPDPVTVPDRSSTLVAIVNQRIPAEEVVFFRPESAGGPLGTTPYRAVKFTNDTPFTLETGPVTLYSGGTFVGEGFVERVEPRSTHFVSFALDGKVSLNSDYSREEEGASLVSIVDGQIISEVLEIERTTYTIKNLNAQAVTAFVKTDRRSDWELRNKPEGTVETTDALIVPLQVPAGKSARLPVEWQKKLVRHVGIDSALGVNVLRIYLKGGKAPPEIAKALEQVLSIKAQLEQNRADSRRIRSQHDDLNRDQERVRENLNTLRKTKGNQALIAELAQKLSKQEDELGKLSGKLVALSEAEAALERQLTAVIKTVSLKQAKSGS